MPRTPDVFSYRRHYLPTEQLYYGDSRNGDLTPALNNIYDVSINFNASATHGKLLSYLIQHGFFTGSSDPGQTLAMYCSEALLPGTELQTSQVSGLRQGVQQTYAVYRRYPDINLTWYTNKEYYTNDVFNAWMEFISPTEVGGGSHGFNTQDRRNAKPSFRRLQYPDTYKVPMQITAFSKDVGNGDRGNNITYYIENAFPTNIVASPLAYGNADLIKTTVAFNYEYYYTDRAAKNGNYLQQSDNWLNTRNPLGGRKDITAWSLGTEKKAATVDPTLANTKKLNRGFGGWRSIVDAATFGRTNLDNDPNYKKK